MIFIYFIIISLKKIKNQFQKITYNTYKNIPNQLIKFLIKIYRILMDYQQQQDYLQYYQQQSKYTITPPKKKNQDLQQSQQDKYYEDQFYQAQEQKDIKLDFQNNLNINYSNMNDQYQLEELKVHSERLNQMKEESHKKNYQQQQYKNPYQMSETDKVSSNNNVNNDQILSLHNRSISSQTEQILPQLTIVSPNEKQKITQQKNVQHIQDKKIEIKVTLKQQDPKKTTDQKIRSKSIKIKTYVAKTNIILQSKSNKKLNQIKSKPEIRNLQKTPEIVQRRPILSKQLNHKKSVDKIYIDAKKVIDRQLPIHQLEQLQDIQIMRKNNEIANKIKQLSVEYEKMIKSKQPLNSNNLTTQLYTNKDIITQQQLQIKNLMWFQKRLSVEYQERLRKESVDCKNKLIMLSKEIKDISLLIKRDDKENFASYKAQRDSEMYDMKTTIIKILIEIEKNQKILQEQNAKTQALNSRIKQIRVSMKSINVTSESLSRANANSKNLLGHYLQLKEKYTRRSQQRQKIKLILTGDLLQKKKENLKLKQQLANQSIKLNRVLQLNEQILSKIKKYEEMILLQQKQKQQQSSQNNMPVSQQQFQNIHNTKYKNEQFVVEEQLMHKNTDQQTTTNMIVEQQHQLQTDGDIPYEVGVEENVENIVENINQQQSIQQGRSIKNKNHSIKVVELGKKHNLINNTNSSNVFSNNLPPPIQTQKTEITEKVSNNNNNIERKKSLTINNNNFNIKEKLKKDNMNINSQNQYYTPSETNHHLPTNVVDQNNAIITSPKQFRLFRNLKHANSDQNKKTESNQKIVEEKQKINTVISQYFVEPKSNTNKLIHEESKMSIPRIRKSLLSDRENSKIKTEASKEDLPAQSLKFPEILSPRNQSLELNPLNIKSKQKFPKGDKKRVRNLKSYLQTEVQQPLKVFEVKQVSTVVISKQMSPKQDEVLDINTLLGIKVQRNYDQQDKLFNIFSG